MIFVAHLGMSQEDTTEAPLWRETLGAQEVEII